MIIDESHTAKGYTPAAQVPQVYGGPRTQDSLTIHHWGAFGQTHDGVVNFFENGPGQTSAHYVVSEGRWTCLVSPWDAAWHAGNATGNRTSIGIECRPEASEGDYRAVAELVAHLRSQVGKDLPLIPHRDWQATACPGQWDLGRIDALARGTSTVVPQSAPAPAQGLPQPGAGQFRVDPGDTLTSIARQFGWTVQSIIDANPGINPNVIKVNQILNDGWGEQVPSNLPPYCTVDPGDTLSGIADQYGVSLQYILDRNPGINPNVIQIGQRINL